MDPRIQQKEATTLEKLMTIKEVKRANIMQQVKDKKLLQREACQCLSLSLRHAQRLIKDYNLTGETSLISKRRGKLPANAFTDEKKVNILKLVRKKYEDFGPTLAVEKLKLDGINISRETLRTWMIEVGLWKSKRKKQVKVFQRRQRRSCFGELQQTDGSYHLWFEHRGEKCCLIIFVDDATSFITGAIFCEVETTENYFHGLETYLKQHGKPLAIYSDKHSIFKDNISKECPNDTQFGRVLKKLDIDLICAQSPQAKGRVERKFGVLQDRWVKEMRLRNISSIEEANLILPELIEEHNKQFGKAALKPKNVHKVAHKRDLQQIAFVEHRKLSKNLTLQYQNILYQIQTKTPNRIHRAQVDIIKRYQEPIRIEYQGINLKYKTWQESLPREAPVAVLNSKQIEALPLGRKRKPKKHHPWR